MFTVLTCFALASSVMLWDVAGWQLLILALIIAVFGIGWRRLTAESRRAREAARLERERERVAARREHARRRSWVKNGWQGDIEDWSLPDGGSGDGGSSGSCSSCSSCGGGGGD